jgi:hypothetical protein
LQELFDQFDRDAFFLTDFFKLGAVFGAANARFRIHLSENLLIMRRNFGKSYADCHPVFLLIKRLEVRLENIKNNNARQDN